MRLRAALFGFIILLVVPLLSAQSKIIISAGTPEDQALQAIYSGKHSSWRSSGKS